MYVIYTYKKYNLFIQMSNLYPITYFIPSTTQTSSKQHGPYAKHDHGPYVVLHGPVRTLLQNEDLQSWVQILDLQNLDLYIGTKIWTYAQGPYFGPMQMYRQNFWSLFWDHILEP